MSGIDEQIRDIPMCPACDNIPLFWVLYPNMEQNVKDGWYWLFSDAYIERHTEYSKLMSKESYLKRSPTLDDIVCIICGSYDNHEFVTDHPVFQEVLQLARRLEE